MLQQTLQPLYKLSQELDACLPEYQERLKKKVYFDFADVSLADGKAELDKLKHEVECLQVKLCNINPCFVRLPE